MNIEQYGLPEDDSNAAFRKWADSLPKPIPDELLIHWHNTMVLPRRVREGNATDKDVREAFNNTLREGGFTTKERKTNNAIQKEMR